MKYIIAGSITKFSTEKRGGGMRVKGIGLGGAKAKSEVALTARLIDATTGEIVALREGPRRVEQGRRLRLQQGRLRRRARTPRSGGSSGLGEAQEKACNEFVAALIAKKDRLE